METKIRLGGILLFCFFFFIVQNIECSRILSKRGGGLSIECNNDAKIYKRDAKIFVEIEQTKTLILTCKLNVDDNEETSFSFNWYIPASLSERSISESDSQQNQINITDIRIQDSGPVICKAFARDNNISFSKEINIKVKPKSNGSCGFNMLQCPDSHCIAKTFFCDGVIDCLDGFDERVEECGEDPCYKKVTCYENRCINPILCCDPIREDNCTHIPECCVQYLEEIRKIGTRNENLENSTKLYILHHSMYTIIGSIFIIAFLMIIVVFFCRRNSPIGWIFNQSGRHRCFHRDEIDTYFHQLRQQGNNEGLNITYNINNGVQIIGAPPPYQSNEFLAPDENQADPPPPYEVNANDEAEPDLNAEDGNNNGDINGNSDHVNQNIVALEAAANNQENQQNDADESQQLHPQANH